MELFRRLLWLKMNDEQLLQDIILTAEEWTPASGLVTPAQKLQVRQADTRSSDLR